MTAHARLSPSNHRWVHCAGSIREEAGYPDIPGEAAIDGTGSHLLLEICLRDKVSAHSLVGQTIGEGDEEKPLGWYVDEARATRVQMCLDYVASRVKELQDRFPHAEVEVKEESRSYPGRCVEPKIDDWWGTCDITITVKVKGLMVYLEVVDYKDGRMYVDAEDNSQLWSYLIGKAYAPRDSNMKARMVIVQPKTSPVVRHSEEVNTSQIWAKQEELAAAARATDDADAPVKAGSWCHWCKANPKNGGHCTAPLMLSLGATDMSTEVTTTPQGLEATIEAVLSNVAEAPAELLATILRAEKQFNDVVKQVKAEAERRLELGQSVPGYYLGEGNAKRAWASDEEALKAFKRAKLKQDEYAPRVQLTPAQVEKLIGAATYKSKVESAVVTVAGNKTLKAGVAPAQTKDVGEMFAEVKPKISFI